MLLSRWTLSKRPLLHLSRRLFSNNDPSSGEPHSIADVSDAYHAEEADAFLRSRGGLLSRVRPTVEAPSVIDTPTIVDPVKVEMPEMKGESDIHRAIRSHNTSLYNLQGQIIVGRVVAVGQRDVSVSLGWKDYQTFNKSELTLSQIYRRFSDEKRKEGDFRIGDELRFRIEELGTPHGDIFVSTQKMRADIRKKLVWDELKDAYQKGKRVCGRVLNPCNAGYAIGVAGFVAFCPLNRLSPNNARKIGVLQEFVVTDMGERIGANLIVVDPHIQFGGVRGGRRDDTRRPSRGMLDRIRLPL